MISQMKHSGGDWCRPARLSFMAVERVPWVLSSIASAEFWEFEDCVLLMLQYSHFPLERTTKLLFMLLLSRYVLLVSESGYTNIQKMSEVIAGEASF